MSGKPRQQKDTRPWALRHPKATGWLVAYGLLAALGGYGAYLHADLDSRCEGVLVRDQWVGFTCAPATTPAKGKP